MPEPQRKWWRRILLVIAVGPGAITIVDTLDRQFLSHEIPEAERFMAYFAMLGALWGFTGGMLRAELSKIIIGINVGAFSGGLYVYIRDQLFQPDAFDMHRNIMHIILVATWGAILGAGLNANRQAFVRSFGGGLLSGFCGFGFMALILATQHFLNIPSFRLPLWLGIFRATLLPSSGLFVFFWLIADVLPRREAARERAEPPFDPPPPSA